VLPFGVGVHNRRNVPENPGNLFPETIPLNKGLARVRMQREAEKAEEEEEEEEGEKSSLLV